MGAAILVAVGLVLGTPGVWGATQYLNDGALQNDQGGFDLPAQGFCPSDLSNGTRPDCQAFRNLATTSAACTTAAGSWSTGLCNDLVNATQATCQTETDRHWNPPVCTLSGSTTSASCATAGGTWTDTSYCSNPVYTTQGTCVANGTPAFSWTTSGRCTVPAATDQTSCQGVVGATWNPGICAITMKYDDRNDVICVQHGGTWVTYTSPAGACQGSWVMPARQAYNPPLLTGTGPGDQCLRCHNSRTQYNNSRVRDTEDTLYMGHKNMSRKVTPGIPWGGPAFSCSLPLYTTEEDCFDNGGTWDPTIYPSDDSGNAFNWTTGQITVGAATYDLTWIYADWIAPLPRAIYKAPALSTQVCSDPRGSAANCVSTYGGTMINNAGASYSCARCHTTGWTSDTLIQNGTAGQLLKEPEKSFAGLTWDRNSNAGPGVVNLSGGVSNDPRKYSSWDTFGITCSRCHSVAVDPANQVSGSNPPQYNAAVGMSTHHSNMTAPDAGGGACSDTRWTSEAQCTANGGTWMTACSIALTPGMCQITAANAAACTTASGTWTDAPFCSNAYYSDSASCTANGFTWTLGWCAGAAPTGTTCATGQTFRANGTQQSCQVAGGTWSFSKCSVAGACNRGTCDNSLYVNQVDCTDNDGTWTGYPDLATCTAAGGQFRYATDVVRCEDAEGRWTGNNTNRGQMITQLCMGCHRQETGGLPYGATSADGVTVDYTNTNPSGQLKVGQYHSTITFLSHPHGNQFLNSPHAKFNGRFDQIATGKFNYLMTGEYKSYFLTDGEAANTGNGCTGCHEVHTSTVAGEDPFREECTGCHAGPYKKDLTKINHLWGKGTPMEHAATEESTACESCHMPGGMHLFRINPDPGYSTFPVAAALATTSALNANTAPEGTYGSAAWVDVDAACGQCHGGGTSYVATTGSITLYTTQGACTAAGGTWANNACNLSKVATVASAAGFLVGERIKIAGAGSFEYDEESYARGDFSSYIAAVNTTTNTITVVGAPPISVTGAAVIQNPRSEIQPGQLAPYYTKAQLAAVAKGIHEDAGTNYPVTFTTTTDPTNPLRVTADATVDCGAAPCPTFNYDWNWGDGSLHGATDPAVHVYGAAGTYPITLTLLEGGLNAGTATRNVTVVAPDFPPVVGGTCTWNADTWTMAVQDLSSDENMATLQVIVDWGDGGAKSNVAPGGTVSKTYGKIGTFPVGQKATDQALQSSTQACGIATPAYFSISGTVYATGGTTVLGGARVTLYKNGVAQTAVTTAADGTYTLGNLRPATTYSITVSRSGYTFANPAASGIVVGPSQTRNITATSGLSSKSPAKLSVGVRH